MEIFADANTLDLIPTSGLDTDRFEDILSNFTISEMQKEALRAKFLEELTWAEIAKEFSFTSRGAAHYFVKQTLVNMREEAEHRRRK